MSAPKTYNLNGFVFHSATDRQHLAERHKFWGAFVIYWESRNAGSEKPSMDDDACRDAFEFFVVGGWLQLRQDQNKPEPKKVSNLPTSPEAQFVSLLYNRKLTTGWSDKEVKTFRKLRQRGVCTVEELNVIQPYYDFQRSDKGMGIHRHDLVTFLNNFDGELDRAKAFAANPKSHEKRNPNGRSADSGRNVGHNAGVSYDRRPNRQNQMDGEPGETPSAV